MRFQTYLKFVVKFDQLNKNSSRFLLKVFTLKFVGNKTLDFFLELKNKFFFSFLSNQNYKKSCSKLQTLRNKNLHNCLDILLCSTFLNKKNKATFYNSFTFFNENFYKILSFSLKFSTIRIFFSYSKFFSLDFNIGE